LAQWFGSYESYDAELGSPIDRTFLIILFIIALRLLVRRRFDLNAFVKNNVPLIVLLGFAIVSITWSNIPVSAFKRFIREILAVTMGMLLLTENSPKQALQAVLRRTFYILIPFSVLLIKYYSHYGVAYHRSTGQKTWLGVCDQKNGLGLLATLSIFFLIWSVVRRLGRPDKRGLRYPILIDILLVILSFWLVKGPGTFSATAVVMLMSGLFCYTMLLLLKKLKIAAIPNISVVIVVLLIMYGTAVPFIGGLVVGDFSSSLGRDSSLTGRDEIWSNLIPFAMNKPILGHGFYSFSARSISKLYANAHNGYLEVILGLGFVGLLLASFFVLASFRKALEEFRNEFNWACLWICWLIMALISNFSESTLHSFSNILMAVLMWLTIIFKLDVASLKKSA
jgi:exopolysaccharide production protein ExoQ